MNSENTIRGGYRNRLSHVVLTVVMVLAMATNVGIAKSLYLIAEVVNFYGPVPVHAYDIGPDGTLTFQTEYGIEFRGAGVIGMAIDSDSESLFITYENSNRIEVLDATTMANERATLASGASDLAGIVYDHERSLLYSMDRGTDNLYAYVWDAVLNKLTNTMDSPHLLEGAEGYGIALDEVNDELYVGGTRREVKVYSTWDWSLVRTIRLSRTALSVAVDPDRGYLYAGAGYVTSPYLVQYNLATGWEREIQVDEDPEVGVIGLSVDPATGLVYITTGRNANPGGDDLKVYDTELQLMQTIEDIGNPTGLAIPGKHTSYNPLRLAKTIKESSSSQTTETGPFFVTIGEEFTYSICFDNKGASLSGVNVLDTLPPELEFVGATGDRVYGRYDPETHTYLWSDPPLSDGLRTCLELVVKVVSETVPGAVIRNLVTLDTDQTPPTTTGKEAIATEALYHPLDLGKFVVTDGPGGTGRALQGFAQPGSRITYEICFSNDNDYEVTNVLLVDYLPEQTTFVRADGNDIFGQYDPYTHTYVWSFPWLGPADSNCLELVVQLDKAAAPGTSILNTTIIDSDETPRTSSSAEVIVGYEPLQLSKTIVAGAFEDPDQKGRLCVSPGEEMTYSICFRNPSEDRAVTDLLIVDGLSPYVNFVRADADGLWGSYDPKTHTYTWRYGTLEPLGQACLELVVRVDATLEQGIIITNTARAEGEETPAVSTSVEVVTCEGMVKADLLLDPTKIVRKEYPPRTSLMAVLHLPEGIGYESIADVPLVLSLGRISAHRQYVYGTSTRGKVLALFDVADLLAATEGYGQFPLRVVGELTSGRTFAGEGSISILKYGGL